MEEDSKTTEQHDCTSTTIVHMTENSAVSNTCRTVICNDTSASATEIVERNTQTTTSEDEVVWFKTDHAMPSVSEHLIDPRLNYGKQCVDYGQIVPVIEASPINQGELFSMFYVLFYGSGLTYFLGCLRI